METIQIVAIVIVSVFAVAAFTLAGFARALFECILFHDTIKLWLGEYYSKQLFDSHKDRNKDGKISYMENAFPKDGGHFVKRVEYGATAFGIVFVCNLCVVLSDYWFVILIMPVAYFLIVSAAFEMSYSTFRYPPRK